VALLTGWNVGIGTNVAGELVHEGLQLCQLEMMQLQY